MTFNSDFVLGIRDTETVADLQKKLQHSKRVLVIGNGGIATELVYELENVEIVWAVKHSSISATFVDAGAAQFFANRLHTTETKKSDCPVSKRAKYTTTPVNVGTGASSGSALGPDWAEGWQIRGTAKRRKVHVIYNVELERLLDNSERPSTSFSPPDFTEKDSWTVYAKLTDGCTVGCDLIVNAIGVQPNAEMWSVGNPALVLADDGGIAVDDQMRTSLCSVFAAGDVCSATWTPAPHWMQARQMGAYAARCMFAASTNTIAQLDICFEIFTHVTTFFGFKVILLGRYNGQGCPSTTHALLRVRPNVEYVKVLVNDGRVMGAVLIGETDLEETLENLILNQTDISHLEDDLLNPTIDIDDYFD